MPRAKAAQRAAASNVAASLAALLSPARAEASRKNGAKSRGPKTPEGKARSSRNALRHGLCAEKHVVVAGESAEAFAAFEAALVGDLAPEGALQTLLAGRIVRAAWRLERAERIEAELFAREMEGLFGGGDLGLALIRDGNGARAFDTLLRYRGAAQAEFARALRMLKALQAEAAQEADQHAPRRAQIEAAPEQAPPEALPNKPEARGNPGDSTTEATHQDEAHEASRQPSAASDLTPARAASAAGSAACDDAPDCRAAASAKMPIEPARRANPGESAPRALPAGRVARGGGASLLAGTALMPPDGAPRPS